MEKIITLTVNPSIDKSSEVANLLPDKKLQCSRPLYQPGGGGVNVSRAIHYLGGVTTAMFLSGGYTGDFFQQLLKKDAIDMISIPIQGYTRENIMIVDQSSGKQYRFNMKGPEIAESEWRACLVELEKQDFNVVVASGSLPQGVPVDFLGQVADIVKRKSAKLIVDTSKEALKFAIQKGVFMIKPNLGELGYLFGREDMQPDEAEKYARKVIHDGGCEVMAVSMGKNGALLVTEKESYLAKTPDIPIKSTVGAGDSMVAGMVYGLSQKWNWKDILSYGVSCGTAATMNAGTALCQKKDADFLFEQIRRS